MLCFGTGFELGDPNQIIMKSRIAHRSNKTSEPQFLFGSSNGSFSSSEIVSMFGSIKVENEAKPDYTNTTGSTDKDDKTESTVDDHLSIVKNCAAIAANFLQITKFKTQHRLESVTDSYVKNLFVASY